MSQIYVSAIVNILAAVLPRLGVDVGSEALTTTLQTIVLLITGVWILIRRHQAGDINVVGARKN